MANLTPQQAFALARQYHQAGRLADAESWYRQVLARQPRHADALHLLGVLCHLTGRNDEAVDLIRRAIAASPRNTDYQNNLGSALTALSRFDEAVAVYEQALKLNPNSPETLNNLGNALNDVGRQNEAVAAYRQALALRPNMAEAYNGLSSALKDMGHVDEALDAIRQAMKLYPADPDFHGNLIYGLHFHMDTDAQSIYHEARRWNDKYARPLAKPVRPFPNTRDPEAGGGGRRLRIGYVSPDFRKHVVGWNLLPCFRHHDHRHFEFFCYSDVDNPDTITEQFQSLADHWQGIVGLGDERAADLVRKDRIDILVDFSLFTAGNHLQLFARKPAPVQMSYLGYCSTTGLDTIDYRLSDPYMDPEGADLSCYSERTLRLPRTYWCYEPGGPAPDPMPPPMLQNGHVTFGCLNNFAKVSSQALELWARILRDVPGSRLILHSKPGTHLQDLRDRMAQWQIGPDRIEFVGKQPWDAYIATYQRIDIALDPLPFAGGITTCDALWMGVPVVTLIGKLAVGRGGLSILSNIGLPDLAANDPDQYVAIATAVASDAPRLAELRQTLRPRMKASPLMDAPSFVRALESLYRHAWQTWCAGTQLHEPDTGGR